MLEQHGGQVEQWSGGSAGFARLIVGPGDLYLRVDLFRIARRDRLVLLRKYRPCIRAVAPDVAVGGCTINANEEVDLVRRLFRGAYVHVVEDPDREGHAIAGDDRLLPRGNLTGGIG